MRFWISTIALLGLVLADGNLPGQEPAYESLFNGKDFAGWKGATGSYEVRDGILVCKKGKSGVLFTEKAVKDCVIRVVYRLPPGGNNGIAVHYPGHGTGSLDGMCEIQLLDDTHTKYAKLDPRQANGSAYGLIAAEKGHQKPVGEWNTMEIRVKGHTLAVKVNGTQVMAGDVSKVEKKMRKDPHPGLLRTEGHIGLCGHRDPVEFKTIEVRPLP